MAPRAKNQKKGSASRNVVAEPSNKKGKRKEDEATSLKNANARIRTESEPSNIARRSVPPRNGKTQLPSTVITNIDSDTETDEDIAPKSVGRRQKRIGKRKADNHKQDPDYAPVHKPLNLANNNNNNVVSQPKGKVGRPRKITVEKKDAGDDPMTTTEKKRVIVEDLNLPALAVIDPATVKRPTPIWFGVVASEIKGNDSTSPLLPGFYLKVKDITTPVSKIKKFLMKKLNLKNCEDEVEISLRGHPLHPATQAHRLMELWVQTAGESEKKKMGAVGGSAEEFLIVLKYSWSAGTSTRSGF